MTTMKTTMKIVVMMRTKMNIKIIMAPVAKLMIKTSRTMRDKRRQNNNDDENVKNPLQFTRKLLEFKLKMGMSHGPGQAAIVYAYERSGISEHAIFKGAVMVIPYCFGIEISHVKIHHECVACCYEVAAVTKLFPMRTIRLDAEHVAEKCPLAHPLDSVEQLI